MQARRKDSADSRVARTIRHLKTLKYFAFQSYTRHDSAKPPKPQEESFTEDCPDTADSSNSKKPTAGAKVFVRSKSRSVGKRCSQSRMTLYSPAQEGQMLETMHDKSLDLMKKSNDIVNAVKAAGMDIGEVCEALFRDRMFRSGIFPALENL